MGSLWRAENRGKVNCAGKRYMSRVSDPSFQSVAVSTVPGLR